jgi:ABC-type multidrug transport system ATPase subunit
MASDPEKQEVSEDSKPEVASRDEDPAIARLQSGTSAHAQLSLREVAPVNVSVRSLNVQVTSSSPSWVAKFFQKASASDHHLKTILNNVAADMPSGSLTAILGGSGSGKTTMLNVLADKLHGRRLDISGSVAFNGFGGPRGLSSVRHAYMKQQDVLIPTLSVRETLRFSADLRLPTTISQEERRAVVEEVILELGLKEAADTRIGNNIHKGCSGGEKRRVSLGVQLLSNPSVLFLDEPTTGLDATSAFQLIRTLKALAKKGRTIIVTVHSPRSEIWNLFDRLILLTRGAPAYSGSVDECLPYFAKLGYELPPFVNPAEHLIDIVAVDNRSPELEEASTQRVQSIVEAWRTHMEENPPTQTQVDVVEIHSKSVFGRVRQTTADFLRQTRVLTARTWLVTVRDPMGMLGSLVEAIGMAVISGLVFLQLGEDIAGIRSREGMLNSTKPGSRWSFIRLPKRPYCG